MGGPAAATPCVNHGSTLPVNHLNAPPANVLNENVVVPDAVSATCENKDVLSENVVIQDAASDTGENQDVLSENVVGVEKIMDKNAEKSIERSSSEKDTTEEKTIEKDEIAITLKAYGADNHVNIMIRVDATIDDLKAKIQDLFAIPPNQQRILANTGVTIEPTSTRNGRTIKREIQDGYSITDFNIQENDILVVGFKRLKMAA